MNQINNHTALPWIAAYGCIYADRDIDEPNEPYIRLMLADRDTSRTIPTERDDNIHFANHACNLFYELVEALEAHIDIYHEGHSHMVAPPSYLEALLERAKRNPRP
jgi:hypothetical protein